MDYVLYASFTTPTNSIGGSAVCAFRLSDIADAFNGKFKEQKDMSANWLPVPEHKVCRDFYKITLYNLPVNMMLY